MTTSPPTSLLITHQHLRMYRVHRGQSEMVEREGSRFEREALQNGTWALIEEMIQAVRALETGLVAPETAAELQTRIQRHTADDSTRQTLRKLAKAWPHIRPPWPLLIFQGLVVALLAAIVWLSKSAAESPVARLVLGVLLWVGLCALGRGVVTIFFE